MRKTGSQSKSFPGLRSYLTKKPDMMTVLKQYGELGVTKLRDATPSDSGETADSWDYEITQTESSWTITWTNSHCTDRGVPIVMLLQYGHATQNGSYVSGVDFINPALKPIFDSIALAAEKEVKNK